MPLGPRVPVERVPLNNRLRVQSSVHVVVVKEEPYPDAARP